MRTIVAGGSAVNEDSRSRGVESRAHVSMRILGCRPQTAFVRGGTARELDSSPMGVVRWLRRLK